MYYASLVLLCILSLFLLTWQTDFITNVVYSRCILEKFSHIIVVLCIPTSCGAWGIIRAS